MVKYLQSSLLPILLLSNFVRGAVFPVDQLRGVNLGSWLVLEPWMVPNEWISMGGASCVACGTCSPSSEFDLVAKLGQDAADVAFNKHWATWFTQDDVDFLAQSGINHVRIPVGGWIIESLVLANETYPRGGFAQLKRGLRMLKAAGITAVIDLHATLGVSAANSMFAGRCVNASNIQFYTPANMNRAYQWASLFTALLYRDADFSTVFGLFGLNEPLIGGHVNEYTSYVSTFVKVVRATEYSLGISCKWPNFNLSKVFDVSLPPLGAPLASLATATYISDPVLLSALTSSATLIPKFFNDWSLPNPFVQPPRLLRRNEMNMWQRQKHEIHRWMKFHKSLFRKRGSSPARCNFNGGGVQIPLGLPGKGNTSGPGTLPGSSQPQRGECISIGFMDASWEDGDGPDPVKFANGPQYREIHSYPYFSGLPDTTSAYMNSACQNKPSTPANNAVGEAAGRVPLIAGEWWLATRMQEDGAPPSLSFFQNFGDAQKLAFNEFADGWVFWSFKIEASFKVPWPNVTGDATRDYRVAVSTGLLPHNASTLLNNNPCQTA